jgi:hypothetical protein
MRRLSRGKYLFVRAPTTIHESPATGHPMTRRTIEIVAFLVALLLSAMSIHAWLASRDEQQRLASTLASEKQLLDAADARERSRESALDTTLAQVEQLKRATQTPEQILRDLPKYLKLPQPITLAPATSASASPATVQPPGQQGIAAGKIAASGQPSAPETSDAAANLPAAPAAQIPAADLKPLYDYVQDCRACQAQLVGAVQNRADDATKISALTRERDAAITASKGGTFWRRLRRNAFWFGVGAAVGAATGAIAGHAASPR